ncbi:DUF6082 family protein [Streptomyces sp. NPDC102340]|uniref:DUF6082 family protein n=1 Tax=unclassified Streptomyces TaxID=2593676 RepID=UPI0037FCA3D3
MLILVAHFEPTGWSRLSDIADVYGGVATAFSILALLGVVVSLVVQSRDAVVNRELTHRSMHSELLSKALEDPELRACWGPITGDDRKDRQHLYTNLIFSFWRSMFEIRLIDESELAALVTEVFAAEPARRYWSGVRVHHHREHADQFVKIVDREYLRMADSAPQA